MRDKSKGKENDLRAAAMAWIKANPDGYALFVRFALERVPTGRRFGIALLTERVRWECTLKADPSGEDPFKINNNHRAYIGRKLVEDHPQLRGLLSFREVRS